MEPFKTLICARIAALCVGATAVASAWAFYGLDINELPRDGDVTIPGEYPIMVRRKNTVQLTGLDKGLTLNIVNRNNQTAVVQISAPTEKKARTLKIVAGVPITYNNNSSKQVTLRVADGDITITSNHPLKVEHPSNKPATIRK